MNAYKAVLFDLDGTLINTMDMNLYPLIRIIQEELGETWTLQQVLPFFAQPGLKTMDDLGIRDKEATYARWVRYVNEYEPGAVPFDGIPQVLQSFQNSGIRMAAVTSKMHGQYQIDVVGNGLDRFLETAVLAEDTQLHKPHPEPIFLCLERMGLSPAQALYVGDTLPDLQAARNAGMDFGFAAWGAVSEVGMEDAQFRFAKPEDLLSLLHDIS